MVAVSSISAIKVDTPFNWLSPAPTLHRMESKIGSLASAQGTKHPICDIKAITPIYHSSQQDQRGCCEASTDLTNICWFSTHVWSSLIRRSVVMLKKIGEKKLTDDLEFTFFCSKGEQELMYLWETRTFNHFHVVRNEIDPILYLQAGVPRFFQNKVAWT